VNWKGLAVEIIRICWDHGYLRDNRILKIICNNWFDCWVDYKTQQSLSNVDRQIDRLTEEPTIETPTFSEEKDGETELGGEMRLRSPWTEE
jgi:hypothetical protein